MAQQDVGLQRQPDPRGLPRNFAGARPFGDRRGWSPSRDDGVRPVVNHFLRAYAVAPRRVRFHRTNEPPMKARCKKESR